MGGFKGGVAIGIGIAVGGLLICAVIGLLQVSFGGGQLASSGGSTNRWSNGN